LVGDGLEEIVPEPPTGLKPSRLGIQFKEFTWSARRSCVIRTRKDDVFSLLNSGHAIGAADNRHQLYATGFKMKILDFFERRKDKPKTGK